MDAKIATKIEKLQAPLKDYQIELRVGNVFKGKGFSVLAYKTARTDVDRLNDVFGLDWSNKYYYDSKDNLICEISIYDGSKWISRCDVGNETDIEAAKGNHSDAAKRAGFKWGIGRELYLFPFIYIPWTEFDDTGKKPKGANVNSWSIKYQGETFEDGFEIFNEKLSSMFKYKMKSGKKPETKQTEPETKVETEPETEDTKEPDYLTMIKNDFVKNEIIDMSDFSKSFGVSKKLETLKHAYETKIIKDNKEYRMIDVYMLFYKSASLKIKSKVNLFIKGMSLNENQIIDMAFNVKKLNESIDFFLKEEGV